MSKTTRKYPRKFDYERARQKIPEHCKLSFCLCTGGAHVYCKVASRKNAESKAFLLSFSDSKKR